MAEYNVHGVPSLAILRIQSTQEWKNNIKEEKTLKLQQTCKTFTENVHFQIFV